MFYDTVKELIAQLKSRMTRFHASGHTADRSSYKCAINQFQLHRKAIDEPLPFTVLDVDLPTSIDSSSYRCLWVKTSQKEELKIKISPMMDKTWLDPVIRHLLAEMLRSYDNNDGFRVNLYINYVYAAMELYERRPFGRYLT